MKSIATIIGVTVLGVTFVASANSPFITKVYDFCPAPGQIVNEIPEIPSDADREEVNAIVLEQIGGDRNPGMISLGAYGGYVVFGFDHPVVNVEGKSDLKIYGNAFVSDMGSGGGSCEPGIVMVSIDANGNGVPDDYWYEIAGSEHDNEAIYKGFKIVYHKPDDDCEPVVDEENPSVVDKEYIMFTTNQPGYETGYVTRNAFHQQSYWPEWLGVETLEFAGTRLPDNGENRGADGEQYWMLKFYERGYVDNLPNSDDEGINIEWAVDADGIPVSLPKIDFVKVYTAVSQSCGWIGETSTEVCGAEDLHPDEIYNDVEGIEDDNRLIMLVRTSRGGICVRTDMDGAIFEVVSANGSRMMQGVLNVGDNRIDTSSLSRGVYILRAGSKNLKFIV